MSPEECVHMNDRTYMRAVGTVLFIIVKTGNNSATITRTMDK